MTRHDFLRVDDRTADELLGLAEAAAELEARFHDRRLPALLEGCRIGLWWDGPGFRNRVAFELGVELLGATAVTIPGPVDGGEATADLGGYLGNWLDALVVRTPELTALETLASSTQAMTVNARTRQNHPCEILGDLAFVASTGRDLTEPLVVVFVGEPTNLLRSWQEAAAVLPLEVRQVCPPGFESASAAVVRHGFDGILDDADVVYTDCWPSGLEADQRAAFADLRITGALLGRCGPDALFLPCPPVTRGEEVSADAMDHPACRVVEAKAWLLHAQNALLVDGLCG